MVYIFFLTYNTSYVITLKIADRFEHVYEVLPEGCMCSTEIYRRDLVKKISVEIYNMHLVEVLKK